MEEKDFDLCFMIHENNHGTHKNKTEKSLC